MDITGVHKLRLVVRNGVSTNENARAVQTPQALFWGQADIILRDGRILHLSELEYDTENIDPGCGIGRDYQGGRVTIVGTEYPDAIPTSPTDHSKEGYIEVDLRHLDAVRFVGCIGCDAFPGDEWQKRKTYAVRTRGKRADFVTVVEPFETNSVIEKADSDGAGMLRVVLKDGRIQRFKVTGIEGENPVVVMEDWSDEKNITVETT